MIAWCDEVLPIGGRCVGILDERGTWHQQPYIVIRPATLNEWKVYASEYGISPQTVERIATTSVMQRRYYYEVATD